MLESRWRKDSQHSLFCPFSTSCLTTQGNTSHFFRKPRFSFLWDLPVSVCLSTPQPVPSQSYLLAPLPCTLTSLKDLCWMLLWAKQWKDNICSRKFHSALSHQEEENRNLLSCETAFLTAFSSLDWCLPFPLESRLEGNVDNVAGDFQQFNEHILSWRWSLHVWLDFFSLSLLPEHRLQFIDWFSLPMRG